ncbi:MAG: hypothetical protein HQ481_05055 [Alphaproteobacteria bacterium]|nr:hypothetical protein [Alphaproteobacteria bacterium]
MRRYDVYFLQKKVAGGWETAEKAPSASVLIGSLVRNFEDREDAAVRVVAANWDKAARDWVFEQVFFVDRAAIDLTLAEPDDEEPDTSPWEPAVSHEPEPETGPAYTMTSNDQEPVPGGRGFADAIQAADREQDLESDSPTKNWSFDDDGKDDVEEDDTFRRLGFTRAGQQAPVGPPPSFSSERRRSGRPLFIIGTVLIALILTGAAAVALMVAFDSPHIHPLIERARELAGGMDHDVGSPPPSMPDTVMPTTSGQVITYVGVAPRLRGRWSSGSCSAGYVEFGDHGYVIVAENRPPSVEIPILETLEDEYTWFLRRSPHLVEHFQKLGSNDIQKIGDTTRSGFLQSTYEIMARCP